MEEGVDARESREALVRDCHWLQRFHSTKIGFCFQGKRCRRIPFHREPIDRLTHIVEL